MMDNEKHMENQLQYSSRPPMTVLGWGTLREGGTTAKTLQYVGLPYVGLSKCKRAMKPHR